jgi:aspartate/methionine/tyrosine aminotransferase
MTRTTGRAMATPYIEWAKLQSAARINLATSGLPPLAVDDIGGWPSPDQLSGPNGYGYAPLLDRIAAHHGVAPGQVVTATGCSMANFLALAALLAPGDEVLIERPTYEPLLHAAAHLGARIVRFERPASHGFRIDADAVIAAMTPQTRAIVLANLHNPSSLQTPNAVLARIGEGAARVGAKVVVDEVYLDTIFDEPPGSCVHLGPAFVATGSLTKAYGLSALRCGWIVGDADLVRRVWRMQDLYGNVQPFAMDVLAAAAFDRLPALSARSRALLDANRAVFAAWSAARDDVAFTLPPSGTTVCLKPLRVEAERLSEVLRREHEVSVVPGRFFEQPDYVRLSLCADTATLREGLRRLTLALASVGANQPHVS